MRRFRAPFPWEDEAKEASSDDELVVESSRVAFPVKLPENGWSMDRQLETRRRRGIDGAANALRREVIRNGGEDPGFDSCRDRVSDAVQTSNVTKQT